MAMVKRVALIGAGWFLLTLGGAGLVLPILPGIPLVLVGLSILSVEYEWARALFASLHRRFPVVYRKFQHMMARVKPSSASTL